MNKTRLPAAIGAAALAAAVVLVPAAPASAATFEVTSLTDDGVGYTLREAIADAEASGDADDIITFAPELANGTLLLDSVLIITESLTIQGLGSGSLSIQTTGDSDYFAFTPTTPGQSFTLSGLRIQGDGNRVGMGLYSSDTAGFGATSVTLSDVVAVDLITSVSGAAAGIYAAGSVSISDSEFIGNESTGDEGGAVSVEDSGPVTVTNSSFFGNWGDDDGGAISVVNVEALRITGSTFGGDGPSDGNGTYEDGGAVSAKQVGTIVDVVDSTFIGNHADESGGGLYTFETTSVSVQGSTFTGNDAEDGSGAALRWTDGQVQLFESVFTDNLNFGDGDDHGGGAWVEEASYLRVYFSTFTGNSAGDGWGGGVFAEYVGTVDVFGSTFRDNFGYSGGGIGTGDDIGGTVVDSSTFDGNRSERGQSVFADEVGDGLLRVINSTLVETPYVDGASYAVAVAGNGLDGLVELQHSTIEGPGGLLVEENAGLVTVTNSIVDGGASPSVAVNGGDPAVAEYSLFSEAAGGDIVDQGGNRFGVTSFGLADLAANGGPTETRLLTPASPAINAGDPAFDGTPQFDQRGPGFPRVQQGRIDIGAVEMPPGLANTGATGTPFWVWIIVGVIVLAGIGFVVFSVLNRRKGRGAASTAPAPSESGGDALFPEASSAPPTAEPPAENDPR